MRSRAHKPPPIRPPESIEEIFDEEDLSGRLRELEDQLEGDRVPGDPLDLLAARLRELEDQLEEMRAGLAENQGSEGTATKRDLPRHVEFPINYEVGSILDRFVATCFFGKDRDEAAGILMRERIRDLAWQQIFNPSSIMGRAFPTPVPFTVLSRGSTVLQGGEEARSVWGCRLMFVAGDKDP